MKSFLLGLLAGWLGATALASADPDIYRDGYALPQNFAIGRMPKPPVLDGDLSDWPADAATILLGQNSQTGRRFNWGGTRDFSGAVRLAWDDSYLYLAADVSDDQLDQATSGAEIWQGDTVELFFNTYPRQQRTDGFWQEAIVPPLLPGVQIKAVGPQKDFEGVEGTAKTHPGGYTLECRIPWKNLTGFTPATNAALGFQIYLDDRDGKGRKTQLFWYPSAISFSRPTHNNILVLRDHGDTAAPQVLAGPNTWLVNDPNKMTVSAVADVVGAKSATVTLIPPFPDATTPAPTAASVTFDLQTTGERVAVGQGILPVTGLAGLYNFEVRVDGAQGESLAANTFQAELQGVKFHQMQDFNKVLKTRVDADKLRTDLDPVALAGLVAWDVRLNGSIFNEARTESISDALLERMLIEFPALQNALDALEAKKDPYEGRTGSFVRAYTSPLTGQFRPYALYVPKDYDPKSKPGAPLIVLLHSIFADERMLAGMADDFKDLGAIVYQGAAYRQFDWGGISAAETWAGLDDVKRHYHIDGDRVYLIGSAIGGRGTWQLAEARPDQWAAITPLFSGIDTKPNYPALGLYPQYYAQAINFQIPPPQVPVPPEPSAVTDPLLRKMFEQDSLVTRLDNIMHLPMVSAYGEDEPNAAAERLAMQQRLEDLGVPLRTSYVPGAMHGSLPDNLGDLTFYHWLLSFTRPAYPKKVHYVATGLRDHSAWWVGIDQFSSPDEVASIDAQLDGTQITVKTTHASAISLNIDQRLAPVGTTLGLQVDGQKLQDIVVADGGLSVQLVCNGDGKWAEGKIPAGQKHSGLSGPIDDFQRDRFMFVCGTGDDDAQKAALKKIGQHFADWGLGAVFTLKADSEVTDSDLHDACLILIGTPSNNSLIAKMADRLPLKWTASGFQLGTASVDGPGAGACLIVPNPLSPERYAVVVTATDDDGYQVWNARSPGGDYVLGKAMPDPGKDKNGKDKKPLFVPSARGWFSNSWQWSADLCLKPGE